MGAVVLGRLTHVPRGRLVGWAALVSILALISYGANIASDGDVPDDLLYRWSSAVGGIVQYTILLVLVLVLARGLAPEVLGLRRPSSWPRALGLTLGGLVSIFAIGAILNIFLKAGEEQGLVPDEWDSSRAAPFVANFVVVAGIAPVVEELTYRGLGLGAVRDHYGTGAAVVVTALAFGLAHGLFVALPVLTIFGLILALLRLRTQSLYPCMILHGVFNGLAMIAAVTT
jgi:uncharacterized protein